MARPVVDVVVAGAINWDINLFVRKFPQPGEETPVFRISRVPGGKAGNVSVAAARLLGPQRVGILGALGQDDIGQTQMRLLQDEGVDTSTISLKSNAESGQAYIVVEESGQNMIHTHFGANGMLTPADILHEVPRKMMETARIITISDPPLEITDAITRIAGDGDRLIAWDPGLRAEAGMEQLRETLLRVDYLFLNEIEIEYMTGAREPSEAASRLSKINPDVKPVLKLGKEGCVMFKKQSAVRVPGIDITEYGLRVINTVGCGDAFLGAFSAAKALDLKDEEALSWANWAGALKAARPETRGSPTRQELETRMARAKMKASR